MAVDTRPNLTQGKFEQCVGDILNLSGCTQVYGNFDVQPNGTIDSCNGYMVSGTTIFKTGRDINGLQIGAGALSCGVGSIAMGQTACTPIAYAIAIGALSCALTTTSLAIGYLAKSTGNTSTVIGQNANALCNSTVVIGGNAYGEGGLNVAVGAGSKAIGMNTVALGYNSCALCQHGIAIGGINTCSMNNGAIAIGNTAMSLTVDSISIGYGSCACGGHYAVAIGECAQAKSGSVVAIGRCAIVSFNNGIAIGLQSCSTNQGYAIGTQACSTGSTSIAIGNTSKGRGGNSIAIGSLAEATMTSNIAMGYNALAYCDYSLAIGNAAKASGYTSNAFGYFSCSKGSQSIAIGVYSCALCNNAVAIGGGPKVLGCDSVAIGGTNCTYAHCTTIVGGVCNINCGVYSSILGGNNNTISSSNSHTTILGGNSVKLTGATSYSSYTIVPNLAIWCTPAGTGNYLCWNSTTKKVGLTQGSEASGDRITKKIHQVSHGFVVWDVVGYRNGNYDKPIADGTYDGEILGIVSKYIDVDNFELTQSGYVSGDTIGFIPDTTYFLSDVAEGFLTDTEPTTDGHISKAIFTADSFSSGWVLPYRGYVVSTGETGGFTSACNGLTSDGTTICLGGNLTQNTCITPVGTNYLRLGTVINSVCVSTGLTNIVNCSCNNGDISGVYLCNNCASLHASSVSAGVVLGSVRVLSATGMVDIASVNSTCSTSIRVLPTCIQVLGCSDFKGIQYCTDFSNNFTTNSLVSKKYVDDHISSASSGSTYNLSSPAVCTVGGITAGMVLTGMTALELIEAILVPEICGTLTAPSNSIAVSPTTSTYEIGCVIASLNVTGNFNQGCINPQGCSSSPKRSGAANRYIFAGAQIAGSYDCTAASVVKTVTNHTVVASQVWNVCVRYDAGVQPYGTKGTAFSSPLASGITSAASCTITGIYPYYWGKLTCATRPPVTSALVAAGTKVVAASTGTLQINFNSASNEWTWLAIPQATASKTCWYVTALDNGKVNTTPSDKYPDECQICVTSAQSCWTNVCYKVYMSGTVGAISATMCFS